MRKRIGRVATLITLIAVLSLPVIAYAGWTYKYGETACFSPRVVMTQVRGTDDHNHWHYDGGVKTFYLDLNWYTTQKSFGHTNTGWRIGALGNLSVSQTFGTCQT
ncbi:MAG: hypothetical protein ACR2JP_11640 [Acidimicrobiia bacterium]